MATDQAGAALAASPASPGTDVPWYRDAVIYQVDPGLFQDSDDDGWGDLRGLTQRLEHVRELGATCLWLLPFYATPYRDGGYDITDHRAIDPRFGTPADFDRLVERAHELGLRVLVELVVQHTSDQHRWFQQARADRSSPFRDFYVWADEPVQTDVEPIFPGVEDSVWTWDELAGQYYRHQFYDHEPDLDLANPRVREEIAKVAEYWLDRGVDGFRVDAVPSIIERTAAADPTDDGLWWLNDLRRHVVERRPDAVLMGEVDEPPELYADYFGDGDRLGLVLNFWVNNHVFLALARHEAAPIVRALEHQPDEPAGARYANWLRNHDELDLERLTEDERAEVMTAFAPDPDMQIYGRGIRRRMAPMLGDPRRSAMSHALLLSLPGVPILRYGDEIGQGDDLTRTERMAVRTPMQWSTEHNAGFTGSTDGLAAPLIRDGAFGYRRVNVADQAGEQDSLLTRTRTMLHVRGGLEEMTAGRCRPVLTGNPAVLALRHDGPTSTVLALVNLGADEAEVVLPELPRPGVLSDAVSDALYERPAAGGTVTLNGFGYRWVRAVRA